MKALRLNLPFIFYKHQIMQTSRGTTSSSTRRNVLGPVEEHTCLPRKCRTPPCLKRFAWVRKDTTVLLLHVPVLPENVKLSRETLAFNL